MAIRLGPDCSDSAAPWRLLRTAAATGRMAAGGHRGSAAERGANGWVRGGRGGTGERGVRDAGG